MPHLVILSPAVHVGDMTRMPSFNIVSYVVSTKTPLSSIVKSRHLSFFGHLVRMDENADDSQSFLSLLLRAGDVYLGGHVLPGWRPSKAISLPWICSCMKPENWLTTDLSGDWRLCIVLHTRSGACCYWKQPLSWFWWNEQLSFML